MHWLETRTPRAERRAAERAPSLVHVELWPVLPPLVAAPGPRPPGTNFLPLPLSSPEQHAVQELTRAAMSGVGIDGEVLSYLELAQVCSSLPFTFSVCSTSSFNADATFRCCICLNKDVTTESQRPPTVCNEKIWEFYVSCTVHPAGLCLNKTTRTPPTRQPPCAPLPLPRGTSFTRGRTTQGMGGEGILSPLNSQTRIGRDQTVSRISWSPVLDASRLTAALLGFFLHQYLLLLTLCFHNPHTHLPPSSIEGLRSSLGLVTT